MIRVEVAGHASVARRMDLLALTPGERRKVLRALGKQLTKTAAKRTQQQTDILGRKYAPRKRKLGGKKDQRVLRKIARKMRVTVHTSDVRVDYAKGLAGSIAAIQQLGLDTEYEVRKAQVRDATAAAANSGAVVDDSKPTKFQIDALIEEGVRVREKGGWKKGKYRKGRRPKASRKWLRDNLSMKKAGSILRSLRGAGKTRWTLPGTPRSFLGMNQQDIDVLLDILIENTIRQATAKAA